MKKTCFLLKTQSSNKRALLVKNVNAYLLIINFLKCNGSVSQDVVLMTELKVHDVERRISSTLFTNVRNNSKPCI